MAPGEVKALVAARDGTQNYGVGDETSGPLPGSRTELLRKVVGRTVALAIVVLTVVAAVHVYGEVERHPRTDDAYVAANSIGIAAHVSGPIVELNVVDNQAIREGEVLFVVDPRPYLVALEQAKAALRLTEREVEAYRAAVHSAHAALEQRVADAKYDRDYLARLLPLARESFVTADSIEKAAANVRASDAAVDQARAERLKAERLLAEIGDVNARMEVARAAVAAAELNVSYCTVRAPFDGYVTNLQIARGQYANQGVQVIALVDARTWYVLANFKETDLEAIEVGAPVDVILAAYPGERFSGTVQGIGWGILNPGDDERGMIPNVRQTLNWVRLAQRFPVRITLDKPDPRYAFRMGATALVTVRPLEGAQPPDGGQKSAPPAVGARERDGGTTRGDGEAAPALESMGLSAPSSARPSAGTAADACALEVAETPASGGSDR